MLPQQVGFVCAVLALVCCASGLFGSLGRCRCRPPQELGGLGWEAAGQRQDVSLFFPVRLVPRVSRAGRAHLGGQRSTLRAVARVPLRCARPLGSQDAAVGMRY